MFQIDCFMIQIRFEDTMAKGFTESVKENDLNKYLLENNYIERFGKFGDQAVI